MTSSNIELNALAEQTILVNAYSSLSAVEAPEFAVQINAQRDLSDAELRPHLQGFIGYVLSRGQDEMSFAKYHIYRHLQKTQQHLSFYIQREDFEDLSNWALQANALIFLADGHVRAPDGAILLNGDDGQSDAEAQIPYPASAWQRKQRNDAVLKEFKLAVPAHLPPVIAASEVRLQQPQAVAERALALFLVALRAESLNSGEPIAVSELTQRLPLSSAFLSEAEVAYLQQDQPDEQANINFCWRYESLALLLWALGKLPELSTATQICEVSQIAELMLAQTESEFLSEPNLRPTQEILDALDFHFRLHWAVRQARQDSQLELGEFIPGVIYERHYALNWLCNFEEADWDQVDTPT